MSLGEASGAGRGVKGLGGSLGIFLFHSRFFPLARQWRAHRVSNHHPDGVFTPAGKLNQQLNQPCRLTTSEKPISLR